MDNQFWIDLGLFALGSLGAFLIIEIDYTLAKRKEGKK